MRRPAVLLALALAVGTAACGGHPKPKTAPPATSPAPQLSVPPRASCPATCTPAGRLGQELDGLFGAPAVRQAIWSIRIQSLDTGELLYALNPDTLVIPASNMKIVTLATAAERLGWDYRFETRLETAAPVVDGALQGDLFVVGTGDPSINAREGDREALFAEWADALRQAGITRIEGRLIGDDDAFEDAQFGSGWEWDDFVYGYTAPVGALQFNQDLVEITVRAGAAAGAPAVAVASPGESGLDIVMRAVTAPAGTEPDIEFFRLPGSDRLEVRGTVPLGGAAVVQEVAVDNATIFFARSLRAALVARGIAITGEAADIDDLPPTDPSAPASLRGGASPATAPGTAAAATGGRRVIARHLSSPLSVTGRTLMKVSQNLYAETLLRALSLVPGPASVAASQKIETEVLASWGIAAGNYALADGSGLSRHNLVTASTIVRILQVMAQSPRHTQAFEATLPVAGIDGTIAGRMKATRAGNNVRAKTGTLTWVRALSGYVTTADGERLVFSIIANHFTAPTKVVDTTVDAALERVANFSKAPATH